MVVDYVAPGRGQTRDTGEDMAEAVLTVHEVASLLKTTPATVYAWCRAGKLPAFKIGQQWRIRAHALNEMMRTGSFSQSNGTQAGEQQVR